jgi:hypothetical protein
MFTVSLVVSPNCYSIKVIHVFGPVNGGAQVRDPFDPSTGPVDEEFDGGLLEVLRSSRSGQTTWQKAVPRQVAGLPAAAGILLCTMRKEVASSSLGLNNHAEISYHLSSGDTVPALFAEFLGKLIYPFGGRLTQGNTARQYPLAAMSEMFHLSIVVVETGALGRPV